MEKKRKQTSNEVVPRKSVRLQNKVEAQKRDWEERKRIRKLEEEKQRKRYEAECKTEEEEPDDFSSQYLNVTSDWNWRSPEAQTAVKKEEPEDEDMIESGEVFVALGGDEDDANVTQDAVPDPKMKVSAPNCNCQAQIADLRKEIEGMEDVAKLMNLQIADYQTQVKALKEQFEQKDLQMKELSEKIERLEKLQMPVTDVCVSSPIRSYIVPHCQFVTSNDLGVRPAETEDSNHRAQVATDPSLGIIDPEHNTGAVAGTKELCRTLVYEVSSARSLLDLQQTACNAVLNGENDKRVVPMDTSFSTEFAVSAPPLTEVSGENGISKSNGSWNARNSSERLKLKKGPCLVLVTSGNSVPPDYHGTRSENIQNVSGRNGVGDTVKINTRKKSNRKGMQPFGEIVEPWCKKLSGGKQMIGCVKLPATGVHVPENVLSQESQSTNQQGGKRLSRKQKLPSPLRKQRNLFEGPKSAPRKCIKRLNRIPKVQRKKLKLKLDEIEKNRRLKIYLCDKCGEEIVGRFKLYYHNIKNHSKIEFKCEVCGVNFGGREDKLQRHKLRKNGCKPIKDKRVCGCGKAYSDRSGLYHHKTKELSGCK